MQSLYQKEKPIDPVDIKLYILILSFVGDSEGSAEDTIEFELKVKCKKNPHAAKDATSHDELYIDHKSKKINK